MAIIRISKQMWEKLPEEKAKGLLLPNPITRTCINYFWNCEDVLIETEIEGFGKSDVACPVYTRDENGLVSMAEIRRGEAMG